MSEDKPKRKYQYSTAQRLKIAARTAERVKNKKAKKRSNAREAKKAREQRKLDNVEQDTALAQAKAVVAKRVVKQIDGKAPKSVGQVVTGEDVEVMGTVLKNVIEDGQDVVFKPNPGPQTEFLAAPETEILYGGSAGGGKSFAMLVDPLRFMHRPAHRALLIRKSMPELMELIDISRQLYPKAFPGAHFREVEKRWMFPSGATLLFGYCDADQDVTRYIGQSYSWIGVDELTLFGTPYVWEMLRSRLRTTDPEITPYMRATTNPGQMGSWWVKRMFIDPAPWNEPFWGTDIENGQTLRFPNSEFVPEDLRGKPALRRRFIPARLTDNPYLMNSPDYMAKLASMPDTQRRRLLEGDWDVVDGCAFPEFQRSTHVVDQFVPPPDWTRIRGCDFGYVAHTAVVWLAIDFEGTVYAYRELYQKGLDAVELAEAIHEAEANEPPGMIGILDNECWAMRGQRGKNIAETMVSCGVRWNKADKGPGSRIHSKIEMHRLFSINPDTGKPGLIVTTACPNLIRVLPMLPLDPNNPEDVDKKFKEQHIYDATRYGATSRLVRAPRYAMEEEYFQKKNRTYQPADSTFGY